MKIALAILGLLAFAFPAYASVAFEDHATLPHGAWQLNTIGSVYPNSLKVVQGQVSELSPEEAFSLYQFAQEFRYGITDWLMFRTTATLGMLQQAQSTQLGIGDLEAFLKANLLEEPFHLSLGLQLTAPTAIPSIFSINGCTNIIPSLMLTHEGSYGSINLTTSYSWGTNEIQQGVVIHPSDTLFLGIAYNREVLNGLTLTMETMATWGFPSLSNGTADPNTSNTQLSIGPGLAWEFIPGHSLLASLQVPYLRQGDLGSTQPAYGFLQYSRDF